MDDYMFRAHVDSCRNVIESTSYLEILNYTDKRLNTCEEHPLTPDEFENFLKRTGVYSPPELKDGVNFVNGIRLILQKNAKHPDTFTPHRISLTSDQYESMVRKMHLPFRAIESTSVVGPFFWSAYDQDDEDPHLQLVFRKSDVRKKGKTRGWELMLSHNFRTGITSGFAKGTESSELVESIRHLTACRGQVGHPLLLPIIILSHELSSKNDQKQREARDWLRRLEHAVSMRSEIEEREGYVRDNVIDLDAINRDLVECHSQVLWKRPQAYQEIIREIEKAMHRFWDRLPEERRNSDEGRDLDKLHRSMFSRLEFYMVKLKGIENYAHTTLERLTIQRSALYNIIAQKESKLNLEMAGQQRRLAHASKRDSTAMKYISLLGALFLPATFLSSVFGMTFFNFQDNGASIVYVAANGTSPDPSTLANLSGGGSVVSPLLWIYFVVTIPITAIIVLSWYLWDRRREKNYAEEDDDLEKGIDEMESKIMASMRRRTMSKASTWNTISAGISSKFSE